MANSSDDGSPNSGGNGVQQGPGPGELLPDADGAAPDAERAGRPVAGDGEVPSEPSDPGVAGRDSDEWATPGPLYKALDSLYGPFEFDLFASEHNAKVGSYFAKDQDALKQDWSALAAWSLFANPPYSRGFQEAVALRARALAETTSKRICLLLQAVTETAWFQDVLMRGGDLHSKSMIETGPLRGVIFKFTFSHCYLDLHLLRGRVQFIDPITGGPVGTGKMGSLVAAFRPKR